MCLDHPGEDITDRPRIDYVLEPKYIIAARPPPYPGQVWNLEEGSSTVHSQLDSALVRDMALQYQLKRT